MDRKTKILKKPTAFNFIISDELLAEKFRRQCAIKNYLVNSLFEDLMVDFLISEGVISSRNDLEVEREMSK